MQKVLRKAPVVGFVRYSQKIIFAERERDMFETEYFEYRFEIFKKVTLKSFQQQTDKNFVLLLLHSENMPSHLKKRFIELEGTNSFLQNIFVKDTMESFNEALQNSIENVLFQEDTAITFRIDNDDAVQNDFIQKLGEFTKKDFVGYSISISNISFVKRISEHSYMIEERYYPSNPIGLAYVTTKNCYKTVLEIGQHDLINDEIPMILLAKNTTVGLLTINGENAINSINSFKSIILDKPEFSQYLIERKLENLDLDCLRIFIKKRSLKEILELFIPPVYYFTVDKIKSVFSSKD